MKKYWVSSFGATGVVGVDDSGVIVFTPPIWKVFMGQRFGKLKKWLYDKDREPCTIREL